MAENEKDLDAESKASTIQTCVYLMRATKPVGTRDVTRSVNLSRSSVAY